jgi:CDP-glucose 4,6-dehydratase
MRSVERVFSGRRVLITGHTGFKGTWLAEWLIGLGAEVVGLSLPAVERHSMLGQLELAKRLDHRNGDVRDGLAVSNLVRQVQPDFVFHLAAQALVRRSYIEPLDTFATNVAGTANMLNALRALDGPCAVVVVTSDKCYLNHERGVAYVETDALGGRDPYSASKAAAEIATAAWRDSFFEPDKISKGLVGPVAIATARAGNVIGGGDSAEDRIFPDCLSALKKNQPIAVRNPSAVRPWQHVLEPLSGYLMLAAQMHEALLDPTAGRLKALCSAFNFGPSAADHRSVAELVQEILRHRPGSWFDASNPSAPHEANLLHLSTDKAQTLLGWRPRWNFAQAVSRTMAWHFAAEGEALALTRQQIADYTQEGAP